MTFDLSPSRIREVGASRLAAAMAEIDAAALLDAPAIAEWIAEAPKRQDRRRWLKAVIAQRAARVYGGPALRAAGLVPKSVKGWSILVSAAARRRPPLAAALDRADAAIRAKLDAPKPEPEILKGKSDDVQAAQ